MSIFGFESYLGAPVRCAAVASPHGSCQGRPALQSLDGEQLLFSHAKACLTVF